jgi:hypothetical protein
MGYYLHECNDVDRKQHRHHPCPPAMLVDRTIEAPGSESPPGPNLRSLGRPLTPEQLLEIDPLPLWLRQQSRARLGTKVSNDDTD